MSEKLIERSSYETKRKVKLNGAGMPQTKLSSGMQSLSLSLSLSFSLSLALKSELTIERMFWTETSLMSLFILKENEKRQDKFFLKNNIFLAENDDRVEATFNNLSFFLWRNQLLSERKKIRKRENTRT